jgi:hypothetical protein
LKINEEERKKKKYVLLLWRQVKMGLDDVVMKDVITSWGVLIDITGIV